eukprot:m.66217 g.66217  ORF g.66217 m.66217 type:complete len:207 (+) comp13583_c0_seq1:217-837(+)
MTCGLRSSPIRDPSVCLLCCSQVLSLGVIADVSWVTSLEVVYPGHYGHEHHSFVPPVPCHDHLCAYRFVCRHVVLDLCCHPGPACLHHIRVCDHHLAYVSYPENGFDHDAVFVGFFGNRNRNGLWSLGHHDDAGLVDVAARHLFPVCALILSLFLHPGFSSFLVPLLLPIPFLFFPYLCVPLRILCVVALVLRLPLLVLLPPLAFS